MYNFDKTNSVLTVDNRKFQLDFNDEDEAIFWEPEIVEIQDLNFTIDDYPEELEISIRSETGFDTYLFYELEILKEDGFLKFQFLCQQPNKYWEGNWGLSNFLATLNDVIISSEDCIVEILDLENDWKELEISFTTKEGFKFEEKINEYAHRIKGFIKEAEKNLSGIVWRIEYETNESKFSTEVLYPLLRKMKFIDVRYTHGIREYGKDFTFSEQTKFGNLRHFGVQAKAGNIRGNVNSDIDEIIGQLEDAFAMPYHEVSSNEERYISTFIVAISGQFTENAKDKIIKKTPNPFKGSVYFLDRDKIIELIERYWIKGAQ